MPVADAACLQSAAQKEPPAAADPDFPRMERMADTMTAKRNRTKQTRSLQERLQIIARQAREHARSLPPGRERELLLRRARQNEVTSHLAEWLTAPAPPTD
jgi:hypothetical protein